MKKIADLFKVMHLDERYFNQVGLTTKFKKRIRTLTCFDFVFALIVNASNAVISYNTLASSLADDIRKLVSAQALQKAMIKDEFSVFLERIYKDVLLTKLNLNTDKLKAKFKRVIIQDSTIIKLPQRLFDKFSGVCNGFVQVANARIQLAWNILANNVVHFSLDSYSANDIKVADQLLIKEGDLILRDRGYFSIKEIIRILNSKAAFIYRYKHGIKYCHIKTGEPINLLKKLSKTKTTDLKVKLGSLDGPTVRLIARPIKNDLANIRRAKLKKESRQTPKKEVLALLSWSIFITSIEDENINYTELFELYKLRWRIEIIFKTMKSHLKLDQIHNVSENQLKFIVLAKLLLVVLIMQFVYEIQLIQIRKIFGKDLSILQLTRFIMDNIYMLGDLIATAVNKRKKHDQLKILAKYCCYDKRSRPNFAHQFTITSLS